MKREQAKSEKKKFFADRVDNEKHKKSFSSGAKKKEEREELRHFRRQLNLLILREVWKKYEARGELLPNAIKILGDEDDSIPRVLFLLSRLTRRIPKNKHKQT